MYGSTEGCVMLILVFLLAYLFWVAVVVGGYVLNGLALFRLARNAGLRYALLAWVPVASTWLLGTLCDRSQQALTGRKWRFAILLPTLELLAAGCGSLLTGTLGFAVECSVYVEYPYSFTREAAGILLGLAYLGTMAVALCQLYRDYAPRWGLLFAILSVVLGGVGRGILLMTIRKKTPLSGAPAGAPPPQAPAYGPAYYGAFYRSGTGTTGWVQPPGGSGTVPGGRDDSSGRNGPGL